MEKKGQIAEIIIKTVYMIISIFMAIVVIKNIFNIFPLFKSAKVDEIQLYELINKTKFGDIFIDIGEADVIDGSIIGKALLSFLVHIELVSMIFLLITLLMLCVYFIFIKWSLVATYLKMSGYLIALYVAKHIFFAISILIFYRADVRSLATGLITGTIFFIIFSLLEVFILSLWIIKFIFNIALDIDTLKKLSY